MHVTMSTNELLNLIILGICGWTLTETVRHGRIIAAIKQRLSDLPCVECKTKIDENGEVFK